MFTIEIFTRVVSYRAERCETTETDHECTGECTWLDGASRQLEAPSLETVQPDAYDLEMHNGDPVAWATEYVKSRTDVRDPSLYPIGPDVPEHAWLSGSYQDPHQGDSRVTETSVYLKGDWTPQQRAAVFRAVTTH